MSLLYDLERRVQVTFTASNDASHDGDIAFLSSKVWDAFASRANRVCLSIASCHIMNPPSHNLICWAIRNDQDEELAIPHQWLQQHRHIFASPASSSSAAMLAVVQPTLLTMVVLTAMSREAYDISSLPDSILDVWLSNDQRILRQGSVYSFNSSVLAMNRDSNVPRQFEYRLDMTEPVSQGYFGVGSTKVLVILDDSNPFIGSPASESATIESEGIEIDESFLANSVLRSRPMLHPNPLLNGVAHPQIDDPSLNVPPAVGFQFQPLAGPQSADDTVVFLRTSDLRKLNVMHGDWLIAHSREQSASRLVRILVGDELVMTKGVALASPLLFYNISKDISLSTELVLESSYGSQPPPLPTARSMTLARVASPVSMNRMHQTPVYHALKYYFAQGKRLVKAGDLIGVAVDTDTSLSTSDVDSSSDLSDSSDEFSYAGSDYADPRHANQIVFFAVTDLEYDEPSKQSRVQLFKQNAEQFGCWVDPSATRMTLAGIVHSRVPDITAYAGIGNNIPSALFSSLPPSSALLAPDSPFGKFLAFTRATLVDGTIECGLRLSTLLIGARGIGKATVASWVAQRLGFHLLELNCYELLGESDAKMEGTLQARFEQAAASSPCILLLRHVDALTTRGAEDVHEPATVHMLRRCIENLQQAWMSSGYPIVVAGTTSEPDRMAITAQSCFRHEIRFETPSEMERYEILRFALRGHAVAPDVSVRSLATQTAALIASDIVDLVRRTKLAAFQRSMNPTFSDDYTQFDFSQAGVVLMLDDFNRGLAKARSSYSEAIGAPKIPNVSWDDVGGLAQVKSEILDTVQLPLDHPELFTGGLKKRSGILLHGPPGTGKTLLAKAVATTCSLNFLSVKGPELLNMYIGESEANVRRVFHRARDAKPCVIFFDELDSVAPKRGNHGDSGGVMDRIVSQLLAELDGISAGKEGADVFVIGATNRPDLLDPALLRPGRFDRMLYLGVSNTHEAQLNIIRALTRKFRLDPTLRLSQIAERCPFHYTGADFYALCSDAMLNAMLRKAKELEAKIATMNALPSHDQHPHIITPHYYLAELATPEDIEVSIVQEDFDLALQDLVPSISKSELEYYSRYQVQSMNN